MDTESRSLSTKEAEQKAQLMVDCMKYHLDDIECLKKSLLSISTLCSSHNNVKDYLRENGCLQFIINLFTSCENALLKKATLFCLACAVDKNIFSQRYMISQHMFDHIHKVFRDRTSEDKLFQAAAFFICCITANNSFGQFNCKTSSCLNDLMKLFRDLIPDDIFSENENNIILGNAILKNAVFFSSICNAICACVNNPRNEENQDICAKFLLQPCLLLIQRCPHLPTIHSILNLIAVLVAGNVKNQDIIRELNGIHIVSDLLRTFTTGSLENVEFLKMAVTVTSTLDSCFLDNASNAEQFGNYGGIKFLVNLLHFCRQKHSELLQVILTVAHATDNSTMNQIRFTEYGGLAVLVPLLSEQIEEELMDAVKYVLHICVPDGSNRVKTGNVTDNESSLENYQEKETGFMSEKLESILHRLDDIDNGGYKAPSVINTSDMNHLLNKNKMENERHQQRKPRYYCQERCEEIEDQEEEEEEEEENNDVPVISDMEASRLFQKPMQNSGLKNTKPLAQKPLFRKPSHVVQESSSKPIVAKKKDRRSKSPSIFTEFDFNLVTQARNGNSDQNNTNKVKQKSNYDDDQHSASTVSANKHIQQRNPLSCEKTLSGLCLGGAAPNKNGKLLLTSRTYNKVIESYPHICSYHRQIRKAEREWISKSVKKTKKGERKMINSIKETPKNKNDSNVYDRISLSDGSDITPPGSESEEEENPALNKLHSFKTVRRKAIRYSEKEIENLLDGVEKMGPFWNQILNAYKFHPSRTSTDLASKYKQMKKKKLNVPSADKRKKHNFSLCEDRRLERGVKKFGHSWTQIWKKYKFGADKVPEDLRCRWRIKNK